jgi:hypothetical protein
MDCKNVRPRFAYLAPFQRQAKAVAWDYLRAAMATARPFGRKHFFSGEPLPCPWVLAGPASTGSFPTGGAPLEIGLPPS